jgi:hypothetical protein
MVCVQTGLNFCKTAANQGGKKGKKRSKGIKKSGLWDKRTTHTETTKGKMRKKVTTRGK